MEFSTAVHYTGRQLSPLNAPFRHEGLGVRLRPESKNSPPYDFHRYPDREVLFMGVPYPGSKLVNGVWYRRMIDGEYRPFPFQNKVQQTQGTAEINMSLDTVLLVDDEAGDREEMGRILCGEGYSVLTADSYREALAVYDRHGSSIRLLIADISLPGGNCCELDIGLRAQNPDMRVLFVSGHVGPEVCQCYRLEVTDEHFLRKPFAAADLLSRVSQILNSEPSFPALCEPPSPKTSAAG